MHLHKSTVVDDVFLKKKQTVVLLVILLANFEPFVCMVGYDDDLLDVMESVVVVSCKCYRCQVIKIIVQIFRDFQDFDF